MAYFNQGSLHRTVDVFFSRTFAGQEKMDEYIPGSKN